MRVAFLGPAGTFTQTSTPTPAARTTLAALNIDPPKKILSLTPAATESAEQRAAVRDRQFFGGMQ